MVMPTLYRLKKAIRVFLLPVALQWTCYCALSDGVIGVRNGQEPFMQERLLPSCALKFYRAIGSKSHNSSISNTSCP